MSLAQRISDQIRKDAIDAHHVPRMTVNECELAAELQRLNAEIAGQRVALDVLRSGQELGKDLQAVRDACAAQIEQAVDEERQSTLGPRLLELAKAMRGQG